MPSSPSPTDLAGADRAHWLRGLEVAHRGLHDARMPENSLAAFEAAVARGMGVECDVQLTADGEAVVFHDFTLDRLTGQTGAVIDRTAAGLATVALTGSGQRIPSLATMLSCIAGRAPILIEVKSRRHWPVARLCAAVERALGTYSGAVGVMSFDPRVGAWFRRHAPHRVRGLVYSEFEKPGLRGMIERHCALWRAKPDFVSCDVRALPAPFTARQRARGLPVTTWTVRTPDLRRIALTHADAPTAEGAGVEWPVA
ncbi:MAG: glycerophosphodiester phosphodiesterase [Sphingomonadales bacterium]|nr:glycerophosphodiester phosphodiesterase [Sphingomonadales bacterium]